jgi:uncharacterized protein (DUF58 family)
MNDAEKQPLKIVDSLVYRLNHDGVNADEIVVMMWEGRRLSISREEGARRVKACLDACAGIPTSELESAARGGKFIHAYDIIRKQRDELMDAAIEVRSFVVGSLPTLGRLSDNDGSRAALEKLRIAIEKAESAK